jgi:anti-sigma factor RsiW
VNCAELQPLLHGYQDGELDLVRNLEIERHLEGCPACAAALKQLQELRQALREPGLYHRPGPQLRERILAALPRQRPFSSTARKVGEGRRRFLAVPLGVAAAVALVALLTWGLQHLRSVQDEDFLVREVVSAHVRSEFPDRLVDVESSDTHRVKPWFNGKVEFAVPVTNLADQGYPLVGGRLDYLDDRKVAALVYQRRKHTINLFLWPAGGGSDQPARALTRKGYHLLHWVHDGFTYWAISDLNAQELCEFAELLQR